MSNSVECPHCYKQTYIDIADFESYDKNDIDIDCEACERSFNVVCKEEVVYSLYSRKIEYGKCKCGKTCRVDKSFHNGIQLLCYDCMIKTFIEFTSSKKCFKYE